MKELHIIKIGGHVLKNEENIQCLLKSLAEKNICMILVHGGGKHVDQWMQKLGAPVQMVEGRRITDALSLELAVMNYAGWINKTMVAGLLSEGRQALGLCGADMGSIISKKREHPTIDFGFVGDVIKINSEFFQWLIEKNIIPVCSAITCDENGQLLNTNADTIAAEIASALSAVYSVHLWYCFEKKGVLQDVMDSESVIPVLDKLVYEKMLTLGQVHSGMKPKLDNCFSALYRGVREIHITDTDGIMNIPDSSGTTVIL